MKTATPAKRPPNDRGQGRKTIDPDGEVMKKRNVRMTESEWDEFKRRTPQAFRNWLAPKKKK